MAGWQDELRALAASLGSRVRRGTNALERLVDHDPYHIVGYRGYATDNRVLLLGRVLQNEGQSEPEPSHSKLRNLVAMLKRLESDPLPFARVRARLPGGDRELIADDEGFIRYWVALDAPPPSGWGSIPLELHDPAGGVSSAGRALYLTPPASAAFGVISDMDDTVLQSHVTDFIRAARMVLLENARTRLPFPGVAAFYRALRRGAAGGAGNPIFYVSSSPWNLYDVDRRVPGGAADPGRTAAAPRLGPRPLGTSERRLQDRCHSRDPDHVSVAPVHSRGRQWPGGPRDLRRHRRHPSGPDPGGIHPERAARSANARPLFETSPNGSLAGARRWCWPTTPSRWRGMRLRTAGSGIRR